MNITDKLYTEWAWRTKSGVPDINNPEDKIILEELIKELTEQEKEDPKKGLLNLINTIEDEERLTKIYRYVKNVGFSNKISSYLKDKNLSPKEVYFFESLLANMNKVGEFAKIAENPPTLDLKTGNYFKQIPGFTPSELKELYLDMKDSIQGTVAMGPGEAFLSVFFGNIKKASGKGDLNINGKEVELKSRTGSTGAIVAPTSITRGSWTKSVKPKVDKFVKSLGLVKQQTDILLDYSSQAWPGKIATVVNQAYKMGINDSILIKGIDIVLESSYPGLKFDTASYISNGVFDSKKFVVDLAKKLAREYYLEHKFEGFMISDPNGNFKYYDKDGFVNAIGTDLIAANPSDLVPRIKI